MRRIALLALLLLPATTLAGSRHTLTGTTYHGHQARLVVDGHLRPHDLLVDFKTRCAGATPVMHGAHLTHLEANDAGTSLVLQSQRMEDGVLHKHWEGWKWFQGGSAHYVLHVSRHPDGSVHAQGHVTVDDQMHVGGPARSKCHGGDRFVVKEDAHN